MTPYVARTKTARDKLRSQPAAQARTVTLSCGHTTDRQPELSNPARWWCCGGWRRTR